MFMAGFGDYIARNGEGVTLSAEDMDALVGRYEWFSTARIVREHLTGERDAVASLVMSGRGVSSLKLEAVDVAGLCEYRAAMRSTDAIIDRFLEFGDYRIVAENGAPELEDEIRTEAEFSDEDDLVSEELAEIYLSQGLKSDALEIYRKLRLRNTEKSVYFAEIIDKIENNN